MATEVSGWFDVTRNGAKPDYAEEIETIFSEIGENEGGVVYFPPGAFTVSSFGRDTPVNCTIMGCGPGTTTLNCDAGMTFSSPPGHAAAAITSLTMLYEAPGSQTEAIHVKGSKDVRLTDLEIIGATTGVHIDGRAAHCNTIICERLTVTQGTPRGYAAILVDGGYNGTNGELHFTDCVITGNDNSDFGWYFNNAQGIYITSCTTNGFDFGLLISPITSDKDADLHTKVFNAFVANSALDGNGYNGYFQAYELNEIYAITITGCSFSNSTRLTGFDSSTVASTALFSGISFSGCRLSGASIHNCIFKHDLQNGILLTSADHVLIGNSSIYGNAQESTQLFAGLFLTGVSEVVAFGNMLTGTGADARATAPGLGVFVGSRADGLTIVSNDMRGNEKDAIRFSGDWRHSYIAGNLGYNPKGHVGTFQPEPGQAYQNPWGQVADLYFSDVSSVRIGNFYNALVTLAFSGNCLVRLGPAQWIEVGGYVDEAGPTWYLE